MWSWLSAALTDPERLWVAEAVFRCPQGERRFRVTGTSASEAVKRGMKLRYGSPGTPMWLSRCSKAGVKLIRRSPMSVLAGSKRPSRKDFKAVADILCKHGASEGLAQALAFYFRAQNPRFNWSRFLAATKRC